MDNLALFGGGGITSLLFPLLILLLFIPIFLSGRKQRRQLAETQALQASLEVGDVVVTTSGLRGTIVDASYEDTVDLEIADGVVTTWVRAAVREKVPATGDGAGDVVHDDADPVVDQSPATSPGAVSPEAPVSLDKGDSSNGATRG